MLEKAYENKGSLAVLGCVSEWELEDIRLNLRLFPLLPLFSLLFALLLTPSLWGSCITTSYAQATYNLGGGICRYGNCIDYNDYSSCLETRAECSISRCPSSINCNGGVCVNAKPSGGSFCISEGSCYMLTFGSNYCSYYTYCKTEAEADSIAQEQCEQSGGTWDSNSKTCKEGAARDSATFLALYNKCILDFEGKPHYEFNNDGNVVGYCDLCEKSEGDENSEYFGYSNKYVQAYVKAAKYQCCQGQGSIDKYTCLASSGGCYGANCQWNVDGGDIGQSSGKGSCDLSNPVAMGLSCEDYANGNEDEQGAGGSSDSGGGGSSDSGEGTDSTGIDFEYDYNDSLHKIIDSLGAMLAIQRLMLQEFTGQSGGDTIIVNGM